MAKREYATAGAFRTALEERLRGRAKELGALAQRLRFIVTFDRFLARLVAESGSDWALKGGYAMELRVSGARSTKDIDLSLRMYDEHSSAEDLGVDLRERLERVAALDLADFFEFTIGAPQDDVANATYGGMRFPVTANVDGRVFQQFWVDIVIGDPPIGDAEILEGEDWLGFAGISPAKVPVIRAEQQFAEKLHAYTFPRSGSPNSRVKDLVDMVLLIKLKAMNPLKLQTAINATFSRRSTHQLPSTIAPPPGDWPSLYAQLAAECRLTETLEESYQIVAQLVSSTISR